MLAKNGYDRQQIMSGLNFAIKRANGESDKKKQEEFLEKLRNNSILKNPYLSANFNKDSEKIAGKYGLNIKAVNAKAKHINDVAKPKAHNVNVCRMEKCVVCNKLQERQDCNMKHVVYEFGCPVCPDCYIGKTDGPLYKRYYQHRMAYNRRDNKNPLVRHNVDKHNSAHQNIDTWKLQLLERCKPDPVHTAIVEARHIDKETPSINKKRECRTLYGGRI